RKSIGFDDAKRSLRAELAAKQPDGLLIRVDVARPARHEARDEYPLKGREIELRLDRGFDGDLVGRRSARDENRGGRCGERRAENPTAFPCSRHWPGH